MKAFTMSQVSDKSPISKRSVTKLLGTIAIGGTIAANLMACSPSLMSNTSSASSLTSVEEVYDFSGGMSGGKKGREETAEQMALLAESLVRPNTLVQAHQVAFRALEHNQYNLRAQFVLKTVAPLIELKGIYSRVMPIVSTRPAKYREFQEHIRDLKAEKNAPVTTAFVIDGPSDLKTEGQVQDVVEKVVDRLDELRDWLKENRKADLTVSYYKDLKDGSTPCIASERTRDVWVLKNCAGKGEKITAKMNIADFETLRQNVSGIQTYIAMSTAYSVDGVFKASEKAPRNEATPAVKHAYFDKVVGLGQLRNTRFFAMLPKVTSDLVVGLKLAKKFHKQICPAGEYKENSRKGMLHHGGICTEQSSKMDRMISTLDLMARGQLAKTTILLDGEIDAVVDTKTFLANPPQDLRSVGPATFDRCGNVGTIGNGTVAGLFVNGELNTSLARSSAQNCR